MRESVKSAVSFIGLILGLIFFYNLYLANKEQSKINQELHEQDIKNCNETYGVAILAIRLIRPPG